ncbi:MAG: hypothetical protein ACKV2T_36720 [Kofleriaceae bacterium]
MESFVDLAYRGLSLGRRVKLTQVRPTTGYLETPAPMPVGTTIAIATDEGHTLDAVVTAIHEQVGGSDKHPGMTVKPALDSSRAVAAWWKERVALPDEEPPIPLSAPRAKSVTVRPRTNTVVEEAPAGATAPSPRTTAPLPVVAPAVDPAMAAALAAASRTVAAAAVEEVGGRTIVMPAVDAETIERSQSDELPVVRISDVMAAATVREARITYDNDVVDDGKKTTMMDAVDLSALGLDLPETTGQMAAVKPDEENGDDEPEPPSRPSQPSLPSSVKKRKKRR